MATKPKTKDDVKDTVQIITEPAKFTSDVSELMNMFQEYRAFKMPKMREWRLIRALFRGDFWDVFSKYLEEFTITPDWNYFEYVVQAFQNSVYSGAFIGTITPLKTTDTEFVDQINEFVAHMWNKWGMKNKYLHAGSNGELYNFGPVRVDWNKRHIKLKDLTPDEVFVDPGVTDYREGDAIFIQRAVNPDSLKRIPDFKEAVEAWLALDKKRIDKTKDYKLAGYETQDTKDNKKVSLVEVFRRNENGGIDQIFILDEDTIILEKLNLPIKHYPIHIYQPQRPDGDPYGRSILLKILNTTIALNLIDSMEATQPYRLLNRVRFVNLDGRINMRSFADYGATPGASFEVKGNPSDIVHYVDVPVIPDMSSLKNRLENSIFQVTGVDPYYKGRATNSVQTTGGTQAMQARVTMLTDNSRITMLEEFTENITRSILEFYLSYSTTDHGKHTIPKMSALGDNKVIGETVIDFGIERKDFDFKYLISASTLLPMNNANLFESAKALYEMQAQYGMQGADRIIEPEDVIRYSDFPQKHLWLQKIAQKKKSNSAEALIADLTNFASIFTRLLASNLSEEQAAQQAISILIEEKNTMMEDPNIGKGMR